MLKRSRKARLIALIAAGFLVTGMVETWSQQPAQNTVERAPMAIGRDDPVHEQIGTDNSSETAQAPGYSGHQGLSSQDDSNSRNSDNEQNAIISGNDWYGWAWFKNPLATFNFLLVIFTGLIAISTGFLFWETKKTSRATRDAVELAETTAKRQLRAYVAVESADARFVNLIEGGQGIVVHIVIRNSGQTPGYGLTTWIQPPKILLPDVIPFGKPLPIPQRNGSSIIAANGTANLWQTIAVSDEQWGSLKSGTKLLFIWGGLDFKDAFDADRHFKFRMVNSSATLVNNPGDMFALQPHRLGYEAN
jgi:hypothetical protein